MGRRGREIGTAAGVSAGLLVLLWAAATGPARVFGSAGREIQIGPTDLPSPSPSASPTADPQEELRRRFEQPGAGYDLQWIGDLIVWTLILVVLVLGAAAATWLWRHRWTPPEREPVEEFDVLPEVEVVSAAIARDAGSHEGELQQGTPRDAIVRCWMRLEESVAAVGLPRAPWETSAELTLRVLHTLDVDPRAIGTLGRLYREARFSEHELGEDARAAALAALRQMHADLQATSPSARGPEVAP